MSDLAGYRSVGQVGRPSHLERCGWFWGWAAVGAAGALGLVSLGPIAWGPAAIMGVVMARSRASRQSLFGLLAGGGLLSLFVAYVQRAGPATTCWHTATASGCDQHLNPVPWLVIGVVLIACAVIAQWRRNGSPAAGS